MEKDNTATAAEQERARRRARRQQRILASAESRLSKITGTQTGLSLFSLLYIKVVSY